MTRPIAAAVAGERYARSSAGEEPQRLDQTVATTRTFAKGKMIDTLERFDAVGVLSVALCSVVKQPT